MKINLPSKIRAGLYAFFTLASPVVVYLSVTEVLGPNEVALFTAVSTAVFGLAALNTDTSKEV